MTSKTQELLRELPSVTQLLEHEEVRDWLDGAPRALVVAAIQAAVQACREEILSGSVHQPFDVETVVARAEEQLAAKSMSSLRKVINATGIVLHTGLGRAPLSDAAIEAIAEGAAGYCNLEYDLATGERGKRTAHVADRLAELTGAEAATVVNNNAAATLLILHAFGTGRESVVSRGQLIEIGGSFRMPEIMQASGTVLREVGTTNRTRLQDYEKAINERTAILLRVHTSNYRVVGFTQEVGIGELAELAHRRGLIAVDDLGSGALMDFSTDGFPNEPHVRESIEAGADLVCFSGDKLLGGPQCGIIAGKRECIARLASDPLMRTYRVDKLVLLALDATLRHYVDPEVARVEIPVWAMLSATTQELAGRAQVLLKQLESALTGEQFFIGSDVTYAGGGSLPGQELETVVIRWRPSKASVESVAAALRQADVPVIARIKDDEILFDLRTLRESDMETLVSSVESVQWEFADETHPVGIRLHVL
ncbi:MAG: L-seryl-tRNA(Sec) selenium transferase [Planctomycetota bacterium]